MMKKLVCLLGAGVIATSFSAISAPTSGNLNFTFQGVIPPAAISPGSWKFIHLSGADYNPSIISFSTTRNSDGSYSLSMVNPEIFAIQTVSGSNQNVNFTVNSNITATLASTIISGTALADNVNPSDFNTDGNINRQIMINGVALTSSPQNVVTNATGNRATLSMSAQVKLPSSSVKNTGGNISMTSAVIFSADVASPPVS